MEVNCKLSDNATYELLNLTNVYCRTQTRMGSTHLYSYKKHAITGFVRAWGGVSTVKRILANVTFKAQWHTCV